VQPSQPSTELPAGPVPLRPSPVSSQASSEERAFVTYALARLRVYAHRLAMDKIKHDGAYDICLECGASARAETRSIDHQLACTTGAVLHWLAQLPDDLPAIEADDLKRDALLSAAQHRDLAALIFEARSLARAQIMTQIPGTEVCHECVQALGLFGVDGHTPECRTGKVLRRLDALCADSEAKFPPPSAAAGESAPAAALFSGEPVHFNEPWALRDGMRDGTLIVDARGCEIADLAMSDVGESSEREFARRIRACVNACAGQPTHQLETIGEAIAQAPRNSYAMLFFHRRHFKAAVVATLRMLLDQAEREAEQAAQPENQAVGIDPDAHLGAVESCEAPVCPCDGTSGCEKGGQS
jgi:hypothetical protein